MRIKQSREDTALDIFNVVLLAFCSFITLYPMYLVAISSISGGTLVARGDVTFLPRSITLSSYKLLMKDRYFGISMFNTVYYTALSTCVSLFMSVLCAYPLSIKTFSGRRWIMRLIAVTMFLSGGMIPNYLVVKSLGLLDTVWALVLPTAISTYNMIVMRSFFEGIPTELRESAFIDGANDIVMLFKITIPLSLPVLATMTLFYATGTWNSFFPALLYISEKSKYPVQLILRNMLIDDQMGEEYANMVSEMDIVPLTLKYASIMISTLPILLVYPFVQKYFVKGINIGAVKE